MRLSIIIPGINMRSVAAIVSMVANISRFEPKEKLASYAGLQDSQGRLISEETYQRWSFRDLILPR